VFREKLSTTLILSAACIAAAMLTDYIVTVLVLRDLESYTPFITLFIATIVTLPVTYVLVGSRYNLRRARDELAAARDAAINANLSKTLFFANMSHELRTPLNAILGFSELLTTDIFADRRVEYARLIHASGAHLLDLVNDLLDISRIESGKLTLHDENVAIDEIVSECVNTMEPRARSARLRLVRRVARDLPLVIGDRRALKQIVLNLMTNAVKFTRPGGTVEAFASLSPSGELAFGVRDDGIGIAEEDCQRVLERFGQARHDVTASQEGAGLGLPIVKGLAEAHGGRLELESRLGEGTCVTVWLPKARLSRRPATALAS
jgi:signal transduction histidine kinase